MHVSLPTGEVIKHDDIKCVQNEGMPIYRDPYEKGQLIIQLDVSLLSLEIELFLLSMLPNGVHL